MNIIEFTVLYIDPQCRKSLNVIAIAVSSLDCTTCAYNSRGSIIKELQVTFCYYRPPHYDNRTTNSLENKEYNDPLTFYTTVQYRIVNIVADNIG